MSDKRKHSAGKGDTPRTMDYQKWSENWDRIFGKKDKPNNGKRDRSKVLHRTTKKTRSSTRKSA